MTLATLPILLHYYGIFGAAVASLLGYTATAGFCVYAIAQSTNLKVSNIVIPTLSAARLLIVRAFGLLPTRHRQLIAGRHRRNSKG